MMQILLTRLQNSRTENFALRFVRFYHFVAAHDDRSLGADFFINITEQVQAG
jgi:exportin-2 (importin alpha re-exporter)